MSIESAIPGVRIAMIMAAGYGTRMADLTRTIPKPLLPLNGLRIIEVLLKKLANAGFQRAVINLHYMPEMVRECLGNGDRYGLEIIYSAEAEILGSGGGIAAAETHFNGETILVVNADTLCDLDIAALSTYHYQHDALATMAVLPSRNNHDYTLVLHDEARRFCRILSKNQPVPPQYGSGIYIGYQILSPQARGYLKPRHQSVIKELYVNATAEGRLIKTFPFSGRWIDVGTAPFYRSLVRRVQRGEVRLTDFM